VLKALLPTTVDARVRALAIATLVLQVLIIGTGGAVRLTGSGLGCPTWPLCTDASLVATPEMGIHGAIEFGNRLLSIIVGIVAVLMVVILLRLRSQRRDLFVSAVIVLFLTVVQGFIGGISVRVRLDPSVVGVHFAISTVLVVLASVIVYRAFFGRRGARAITGWLAPLTHVTSLFVAITVIVGILTTGSGPHAGDAATDRNGLDSELMQHVHSWPAYATVALTLVLLVGAVRSGRGILRCAAIALFAIELVQITVGITQARLGLPPLLVGIHMVLAALLAAAMAWVVLSLRESVRDENVLRNAVLD
jgi:cytochrome c oxidase assembly protein subunit 15